MRGYRERTTRVLTKFFSYSIDFSSSIDIYLNKLLGTHTAQESALRQEPIILVLFNHGPLQS